MCTYMHTCICVYVVRMYICMYIYVYTTYSLYSMCDYACACKPACKHVCTNTPGSGNLPLLQHTSWSFPFS